MRRIAFLLVDLFVLMVLGCAIGAGEPLIFTVTILFGWIKFLIRTLPAVQFPPESLAVGLGCIICIFVLGHVTARWLRREISPDAPPWRLRSTAMVVGTIVLMFACGMAATGVGHQIGWLMNDEGPMWRSPYPAVNQLKCESNLNQIGFKLEYWAKAHEGRLPNSLDELDLDSDSIKHTCVSDVGLPYIYYGRGQTWPLPDDVPLTAEPLANHDGEGMNIMFGNGYVEFIEADQVAAVLARRPSLLPPDTGGDE